MTSLCCHCDVILQVFKRRGEEYALFWPDTSELARIAARLNATIVPFSAVGGDESFELVVDSDELLASETPLGAFFLTFYVAPTLTLHPTSSKNADAAFREKHAGGLLSPPFDSERVAELGDFESHTVEIDGRGFEGAAADVTLAGLGWLAVYGSGRCSLRVSALPGVAVATREPLLPFEDLRRTTAKFTGGRVLRGQSKAKGKKPSRRRRR